MKKIIVPDIRCFASVSNFSLLVEFTENYYRGFRENSSSRMIDFRETTMGDMQKCRVVDRGTKEYDCPEYLEWVIGFSGTTSQEDEGRTVFVIPKLLVCTKCFNKRHYYIFDDAPYKYCEVDDASEELAARILAESLNPVKQFANFYRWNIYTRRLMRHDPLADFDDEKVDEVDLMHNCLTDRIVFEKKPHKFEIDHIVSIIRVRKGEYCDFTHRRQERDEVYALSLDHGAIQLGERNFCLVAD